MAIALHWVTAYLVFSNFALSQVWDRVPKPIGSLMEKTHMSFGVLLTAVIVARLLWALDSGAPGVIVGSGLGAHRFEGGALSTLCAAHR